MEGVFSLIRLIPRLDVELALRIVPTDGTTAIIHLPDFVQYRCPRMLDRRLNALLPCTPRSSIILGKKRCRGG